MEVYSPALIISYLKYGETSSIVRFFTQEKGFVSLLWKGAYAPKNKSKHLLTPLHAVYVGFRHKENANLPLLKKIEPQENSKYHYLSIEQNTILLFLSEVLQSVLQNEPENQELYTLLTQRIIDFKQQPNTQLWVQKLLLDMMTLLGCKPYNNFTENAVFNLESGEFNAYSQPYSLGHEDSKLWAQFLTEDGLIQGLNPAERLTILQIELHYFQLQLPSFRPPKSLEIIKEIFSS